MSDLRLDGVRVPAALCPAVSRLLRRGIDAARADDYRPGPAMQEFVAALMDAGREQVMSERGPISGPVADIEAGSTPVEIDTAEAAGLLGMQERSVRRLAFHGELRGRQTAGGVWLIERKSVDERIGRRR